MIILSEVSQPTLGIRLTQPQVVAYMERESVGEGTLCVAESQVTWICRRTGLGFSLTYPSIVLHAVSTDLSTFPHECIYIVVDASKSGNICHWTRALIQVFYAFLSSSLVSGRTIGICRPVAPAHNYMRDCSAEGEIGDEADENMEDNANAFVADTGSFKALSPKTLPFDDDKQVFQVT
ncbi:hypothetical protein KIN20_029741 [Parelaphostrongylus tenuis]|uniref:Methylosome subunit pICln n=1 Tax=Parelaphostrongylus tenuis TaxID=148309 RepID=A0AAD5R380_PARTN|nr:hypothetical protein KIN20_029741 [Parelaphostrongylus tenuis]